MWCLEVIGRHVLRDQIERLLQPQEPINQLVYDVNDPSIARGAQHTKYESELAALLMPFSSCLHFESRFECGNLWQAHQVYPLVYNLIMSPDTNHTRHLQWFYFSVKNMVANVPYQFNIINFEKRKSEFNSGMPVLQPYFWSHWC